MAKIKICGLCRTEDIEYANTVFPDYIGFIFAMNRVRTVSVKKALNLKSRLRSEIIPVGVFLNQDMEYIKSIADKKIIKAVQLHGSEDEKFILDLKKQLKLPIIKAFSITCKEDVKKACSSSADYILLDNKTPGSGQSFDWTLIKGINRPFFLAGGLSAENIKEALTIDPYAVDVSSGVETKGKKDISKMKAFTDIIRQHRTSND